jgi:hypothetical protein
MAILGFLANRGRSNKWNLLGKPLQRGDLELYLRCNFDQSTRALCAKALRDLEDSGLVESDFADLANPADWVELAARGHRALDSGALDGLDKTLSALSPRLIDIRDGIDDALGGGGPDSLRQAADSTWELISQALRLAAPDDEVWAADWFVPDQTADNGITRHDRARLIMERNHGAADEDACTMLVAAVRRLGKLKHPGAGLERGQVELAVRQGEDALRAVLLSPKDLEV